VTNEVNVISEHSQVYISSKKGKKRQNKGKAVPLHAMEALGGESRYSSYSFTTSALDGGEWSASRPSRAFTPGERTPSTHWSGGWVGPRAGLDTEEEKILCPCRGSNPDRPVVQPVVRHYTAWANPAPLYIWYHFIYKTLSITIAYIDVWNWNRGHRSKPTTSANSVEK
jgi:hypothetical protein